MTGARIQQWAECIHYVPGGASLGRSANGSDADDAGAVASADDCASSTSHPVVTQWCRHAGHFMTASCTQCACVRLHSVAAAAMS